MIIHFDPPMKKKKHMTYIDVTILQSQSKNQMYFILNENRTLLRKAGFEDAPDKSSFSSPQEGEIF